MLTFNGSLKFLDQRPVFSVQTDACSQGAGAYYIGAFVYANWLFDMP